MVRRRTSAVSNHEARALASSFETLASQGPQDEGMELIATQLNQDAQCIRPCARKKVSPLAVTITRIPSTEGRRAT
ncbi:hypothetical protein ACVILL_004406 [Bradyrhizobium sp. USDA 3364]